MQRAKAQGKRIGGRISKTPFWCGICQERFETNKDKTEHKRLYPNGICNKSFGGIETTSPASTKNG
jgi:hypothetical protein